MSWRKKIVGCRPRAHLTAREKQTDTQAELVPKPPWRWESSRYVGLRLCHSPTYRFSSHGATSFLDSPGPCLTLSSAEVVVCRRLEPKDAQRRIQHIREKGIHEEQEGDTDHDQQQTAAAGHQPRSPPGCLRLVGGDASRSRRRGRHASPVSGPAPPLLSASGPPRSDRFGP